MTHIEYEATFENINRDSVTAKLIQLGAQKIYDKHLLKRVAFNLPTPSNDAWARVRQEADKITMSYKKISAGGIESQKEVELTIGSFDDGVAMLESIGCVKKAYQENYREVWILGSVTITIDEWPFLEPFVEIEGCDEISVISASNKLGFEWKDAIFDAVSYLYSKKYGISRERINNETPVIVFEMHNPFL